jgi:glycosyltransferase involved in cell wall biosynthesis
MNDNLHQNNNLDSNSNNSDITKNKTKKIAKKKSKNKNKIFTKKNLLFFFIPLIIFLNIYLINKNPAIEELKEKIIELESNNPMIKELNKKIIELESKIDELEKNSVKKKIKIGLVSQHIYLNGIARFLIVLAELLLKTGKYEVYLINEQSSEMDFKFNKGIKRHIVKKEFQALKDFDEEHDIQIYIINNDLSNIIDFFHSFGKKVIGIFHGVFLSCSFQNYTNIYRSWQYFSKLDSFVHIIPDDYWVYKKFGFNNTIYIPNIYTFEAKNTPTSPLRHKNLLMVGRVDDVIKGAKFGILAMAEILKEVPDARMTIIGIQPPQHLKDLIKELKIEDKINYPGFSYNITEFYLNASVLLVTSVSESYPMVMNEAKAHGLPIVAFNVDYSPCYQSGVIKVEMFDYKAMAKESIKLLNNYSYRKKAGKESKLSLNNFETNAEKVEMWDNLFQSLMNGIEPYKKLQQKTEKKYYNETLAKAHLEKHYKYAQQFNEYFRCHSFEDFTTLEYLNNIEVCKI